GRLHHDRPPHPRPHARQRLLPPHRRPDQRRHALPRRARQHPQARGLPGDRAQHHPAPVRPAGRGRRLARPRRRDDDRRLEAGVRPLRASWQSDGPARRRDLGGLTGGQGEWARRAHSPCPRKEELAMENRPILWVVGTRLTVPDRLEEFKKWYDEDHIPTLLEAPGVIRATRYERLRASTDAPEHLVVYELTNEEAIEAINQSAA